MPTEWNTAPLGDLVSDILDRRGVTPRKLGSNFTKIGHRVLSAKLVKNGVLDLGADEPRFVDDATYGKWMKSPLLPDDVLLTSEAPLGETAYIRAQSEWCLGQRLYCIRTDKSKLDGHFLYYALQSGATRDDVMKRATGTTVEGIRQAELRKVLVRFPSVPEQRRIATVLGTLDAKIKLNRELSEALDTMSRALFKSWFIDYEPVRAEHNGHRMGAARGPLSLFPSSFDAVGSRDTMVPAGWKLEPIGDHFSVTKGLSYKGAGLRNAGVPLHNLNSIYEGGGYKRSGIKHYEGEHRSVHETRAGDLLVANTEQGHKRLLIGYAALVPQEAEDGIATHHLFRVRPKQGSRLSNFYLAYLLNSSAMHDVVSGYANGTTINMLPQEALTRPLIVVPSPELITVFDRFALMVERRVSLLSQESQSLSELRAHLMPRLVSGELRVPAPIATPNRTPTT